PRLRALPPRRMGTHARMCARNEKETMMAVLDGKNVAFIATNGFEDVELTSPWHELDEAGALLTMVSSSTEVITGNNGPTKQGDFASRQVRASEYDALVDRKSVV